MGGAVAAGGAQQNPPAPTTENKLANGWRVGLVVLALVFLVGAGVEWFTPIPPTAKTVVEKTSKTGKVAATATATTPGQRETSDKTTKETTTIDGRRSQSNEAEPPGNATRSETLTVALLTASLVCFVLAAIGQVPTKFGFAGTTWEYPTPKLPPDGATQLAVAAKERDATPEQVKEAAALMAWDAWIADLLVTLPSKGEAPNLPDVEVRQRYWEPSTAVASYPLLFAQGRTSPGDDEWLQLARHALDTVEEPAPPADEPEGPGGETG